MKYYRQREEIYGMVKKMQSHPTADDVYTALKPIHPQLSLGTVYRNLNVLCQSGQLRKIEIPNSSDRFDATLVPHYHFLCTQCGRVIDVELLELPDRLDTLAHQAGFSITSHELTIRGACKDCSVEQESLSACKQRPPV